MTGMTRGERSDLLSLAKARVRNGEKLLDERRKILLARVEEELAATYDAYDQAWEAEYRAAKEAADALNAKIAASFAAAGFSARRAPEFTHHWYDRGETVSASRRAELRKLATARLDAHMASAKAELSSWALKIETDLVSEGLTTGRAREFLDAMPSTEALLPQQDLGQLTGRNLWKPPANAADVLMSTRSMAEEIRALGQGSGAAGLPAGGETP